MNAQATSTEVEPASSSANLTDTPKFKDIVVAIHGIGPQHRFATVRSVATRLAASKTLLGNSMCSPVAPQPLGYFHSDLRRMTSVSLLDDAQSLKNADLASIGFAEVFWADIPQNVVKEGRTLEETKAWARTVVARARALLKQAERENRPGIIPPDFGLAAEVLDEIIDTVYVLENLLFLADKAGVFHFDLSNILDNYIGNVQIVTEFMEYREDILSRFDTAMHDIYTKYCENDPEVRLHIVAHSEGTVVSFLGMLHAMSGRVFLLDTSSNPHRAVAQEGAIPKWLGRVKGYMTIGSPIDKHLLLWPRLWQVLKPQQANELFRKERIHWRNYYDYGDPIGFELDTARLWLLENNCAAFEFCGCPKCHHDIGFARYMLPGEAHVQYWQDAQVFEHFINAVVRSGKEPAMAPKSKPLVAGLSPLLPYLLSFLILLLGVYILHNAIHAYTHPGLDPLQKFVRFTELGISPPPETSQWETIRAIVGIGCLIAAGTLLARLPRLAVGPCWRRFAEPQVVRQRPRWSKLASVVTWKIAGLGAFLLGSLLYWVLVPSAIRDEIGRAFGSPTITIIFLILIGSMFGYLATSSRFGHEDRSQRWLLRGMRPLILCGAMTLGTVIFFQIPTPSPDPKILEAAGVAPLTTKEIEIVKEANLTPDELKDVIKKRGSDWVATLERVQPVTASHPAAWPVVISSIAFLYLWWLGTLVFDLAFVWQRYVRNSVTNHRLLEWNPYKFALRTETGKERANIHYEQPNSD